MNELFVVGKYKAETEYGAAWEFEGVFETKEKAEAACLDENYFVGPATLNVAVGTDGDEWPNCYYPKAE